VTCKHYAEHGEGVVWPVDVSLDHFDNCLDAEARHMVWRTTRQLADSAARCFREDHDGAIYQLRRSHHPRPVRGERGGNYRARARRRTRRNR
jgi:hypothetical protein